MLGALSLQQAAGSALVAVALCGCAASAEREQQEAAKPLPDLGWFLGEVRKNLRSDRLLLSQYTYTAKETEHRLSKNGELKKSEVSVYEVYPSFEEGMTYRRLISKDGKPVTAKELERQDRAHDKKVLEKQRKLEREGADERARRQAKEAEERRKEDAAIDELFRLYQVDMEGRQILDGHPALVLRFRPKPGYKTKTSEAKILRRIAGRAWFGEEDRQLIRVEAELIDTVSIGLGMLARLNKGAKMSFERRRVNNEIWLPAMAHFSGTGRLFLLKGLNIDASSEYSDYKKFTVETSVSYRSHKNP